MRCADGSRPTSAACPLETSRRTWLWRTWRESWAFPWAVTDIKAAAHNSAASADRKRVSIPSFIVFLYSISKKQRLKPESHKSFERPNLRRCDDSAIRPFKKLKLSFLGNATSLSPD